MTTPKPFRCGCPRTPENTRMKKHSNGHYYAQCRGCLNARERTYRKSSQLPLNFEARWPILDTTIPEPDLIAEATADLGNVRPAGHRIIRQEWAVEGDQLVLRAHALPIANPRRGPDFPMLPVEPLLAFVRHRDLNATDAKALERAKREGQLSIHAADKIACSLGMHPGLIWVQWFDLEGAA